MENEFFLFLLDELNVMMKYWLNGIFLEGTVWLCGIYILSML